MCLKSKLTFITAIIVVIVASVLIALSLSNTRKVEIVQPETHYQLQYRILFDESLSGAEMIELAARDDYDIVFFSEAQLKQAGEKVKDIAKDRLAVFTRISLKKADEYILSDDIEVIAPDGDLASASCFSVCKNSATLSGETVVSGEFHNENADDLIETISKFWHEQQVGIAKSQGLPSL